MRLIGVVTRFYYLYLSAIFVWTTIGSLFFAFDAIWGARVFYGDLTRHPVSIFEFFTLLLFVGSSLSLALTCLWKRRSVSEDPPRECNALRIALALLVACVLVGWLHRGAIQIVLIDDFETGHRLRYSIYVLWTFCLVLLFFWPWVYPKAGGNLACDGTQVGEGG